MVASWSMNGSSRPMSPKNPGFSKRNIILIGPPGSGKTSVGRALAPLLHKPLIDIDDHWLEPRWMCSVASKLAELGDEKFIEAEGEELLAFNLQDHVVSLTGSNPLHRKSMEHLSKTGIFVYLDVSRQVILDRCEIMQVDRIVGQTTKSLNEILEWRQNIYENSYDIRIIIGKNELPLDIANKICQQLEVQSKFYRSTRDDRTEEKFDEFLDVVEKGLAPDGGLYVPESFSPFSLVELERLIGLSYPEIGLRVIERFPLGRLHPSTLRSLLETAYSSFPVDVLPISHLKENQYLIEQYHGPTGSFKDLSLQLLPLLMKTAMDLNHENEKKILGLLVATSGDTGCAALDGFSRVSSCPVIVLYPKDGVSLIQKLQMETATGDVCVLGIDGDFDFCQNLVKELFNDENFQKRIKKIVPNLCLSSGNSINWARFVPQIVFSFSSFLKILSEKNRKLTDPIEICIPTGNFGNMLGAVFARRLGLPIRRLITASNENNIVADFVQTGIYDLRKRKFHRTISPSIDILISSNIERFLFLVSDGDSRSIRNFFDQLNKEKIFRVDPILTERIQNELSADWADQVECLETIKRVFHQTNKLIDPHTAVAVRVAEKLQQDQQIPIFISSTAHFSKFPQTIFQALDRPCPNTIEQMFDEIVKLSSSSSMHQQILQLKNRTTFHENFLEPKKSIIVDRIEQVFSRFSRSENKTLAR